MEIEALQSWDTAGIESDMGSRSSLSEGNDTFLMNVYNYF
jgi:hypothetical protein